jgi:hypothetical protein
MIKNKKILVRDLVNHLKRLEFAKHLVGYINNEIPLTIFPIAKREGLTINEWVRDVEDDVRQHTVLTTTRLSYDGVKSFLVYKLNTILSSYKDANIKVLKITEIVNTEDIEEIEDKSFDAIFEFNGEIVIIEIKVTQSDKGFTGATHTTSKADIFLLISLSINRDKKVEEESQYVDGIFGMLINMDKNNWKGEAKNNSSFTQLTFSSNINYDEYIFSGSIKKNKVNQKIIFEKI